MKKLYRRPLAGIPILLSPSKAGGKPAWLISLSVAFNRVTSQAAYPPPVPTSLMLTVRETADIARTGEVVRSGIPLPRGLNLSKRFYFTRVFEGASAFRGQKATTLLSIANPNTDPITVKLSLFGSSNQVPVEACCPIQLPTQNTIIGLNASFGNPANISYSAQPWLRFERMYQSAKNG